MEQQHQRGGESELCDEAGTIVVAINQEQQQKQQQPRWQNPISSILSHLFGFLRHLHLQSNQRRAEEGSSTSSLETDFDVTFSPSSSTSPETEAEEQLQVVSFVKFPKIQPAFPSLKLDPEEAPRDTTSSAFWQVSALGTIIILRWAWARWKERTTRNESSSDEQPLPNDD